MTYRSLYPARMSVTQSMRVTTRSLGVQRWFFNYEWSLLTSDQAADLRGFLHAQKGQYDSFTIIPPGISTARGSFAGSPLVQGAHAAGVESVTLDGLTPSATNIARRGDFIKFNNHAKVYQITADVNANGSGVAVLPVLPPLMAALSDNEPIVTSSIPFTVGLVGDAVEQTVQPPVLGSMSLQMVERP